MVRKTVTRPHAGNENGKFTKENKLSVKKNEGSGYFISATQQHFHLILVPGEITALLLNLIV